MPETAEPYDIPVRISKQLIDGVVLIETLLNRMKASELAKFRAAIEAPVICKGDAKLTMQMVASIGLMFVSAMREARKVHAARAAAGEPMQTMQTVKEPKRRNGDGDAA